MQNKRDEHPSVTFLKHLYQHCDKGFINLRFLPHIENLFIPIEQIDSIPSMLEIHKKQDCYFAVATRTEGDGSKDGIIQIPAVWVDLDVYKLTDEQKATSRQRYKDSPLKPTFVIDSGGGRYFLWMLKKPTFKEDIFKVENLLKRFASYFHGDMAATDASRILRIPGSLNHKYPHHPQVKLTESHPERQYSPDDFDSLLPQVERVVNGEEKSRLPEGWEKELLEGVSEGERNNVITRLAGRYIGKGLSRGEVLPILLDTNARFNPPLNVKEVETCLDSVLKTDKRKHPDNEAPVNCQEKSGHHFNLIRANDIVNTQEPEREWIWQGILISGGSSLIVAKPKIGKTTLALQLAVAVSRGDIFLGRKTRQATVVYLALEEHRDEVQKNLSKLGVTNEPLLIHFGPAPAQAMQEVEPLIRETGAKLLVIDILQKFCRVKDLNDYSQVTRTLEPLMAAGRNLDCQISLTHHAGKADREDGDDILGSTGLLGGVDTSIHIKKRNSDSRLFSTIQRYGTDVPQTVIALKDACLVMEGSREEVEIEETVPLILEALGEGSLAEKDIWAKVEKDHSRVSSALRKLVEQKAVIRTGTGKRGNPFIYEKDSLLLSSYIYEEGKREIKVEPNLLESDNNISLDHFHKNQPPQERIEREIPIENQVEKDPSKGGLYEVTDDGQRTY